MMVALTLILVIGRVGHASSGMLVAAAFVGAMLSTGFVLLLAKKIQGMSVLLIGGIMISYICSAITDFLVTFADDADIVNLHGWSLGSFSGADWDEVKLAFVLVGIAFALTFLLSKPMGAYQLGEAYAMSMGVPITAFRVALILLSGILSACVTAFAGPISFVGIAVPYLIKRALHTAKPLPVIAATFLGGSVFCMFCDLLARTLFAPSELNISTVTALFGAPVVIFMLLQRKGGVS
jgi:iron complex transport system permease protein